MNPHAVILEAIATRRCVLVTYNRTAVKLAPHILYTRHDAPHLDAVTIEHGGRAPRERKLGTFKLSGLTESMILPDAFVPDRSFDPASEKYSGTTLFAVEV